MLMEGPKGRLAYQGLGRFLIGKKQMKKSRVGLVAGGTGITPCFQVIKAALSYKMDKTHLSLLFGNRTVDDILLHQEIKGLQIMHPSQFKAHFTVDIQPDQTH